MSEAPLGWQRSTLSKVAELFSGRASGTGVGQLRVFKTRHVYDGYVRLTDPAFVPPERAARVPLNTHLRPGDTLTPNMAHGTIGRVAFVRDAGANWTVDGQVMVIRARDGVAVGRYIYDWLSRPESKSQLVAMEKGGAFGEMRGQTHIYCADVGTMQVLLPPLLEQRKIAAILSSVDDAIAATQAVIEQVRVVKKAVMAELLTRGIPGRHTKFKPTIIGDLPEEWQVQHVEDFAQIRTGNKNTQDRVRGGAYPLIVRSQTAERIDTFSFDGEAVLTAGDGVGTGKVFHYMTGKFDYHQRVYNIHAFKPWVHGKFFFFYFQRFFIDQVRKFSARNSVDSVRLAMIARMAVPIPSLPEQHLIADALTAIDNRIEAEERCQEEHQAVKKALMSVLLTGDVRVKPDKGAT